MTPSVFAITCFVFICQWTLSHSECSSPLRVRKPWHRLSAEEQLLYSSGYQILRQNGILILFDEAHEDAGDNVATHHNTQTFFWHSYWLYELENSFRSLGPEYECYTLPYWDVTHDADYWSTTEDPQIEDIPIYNSNLGGNGNIDNDYCVEDELWGIAEYDTEFLCADDEVSPHCCLKRWHIDSEAAALSTSTQIGDAIFVN